MPTPHNPRNLNFKQVGNGWRLLDVDEIKERWHGGTKHLQMWRWGRNGWGWYAKDPEGRVYQGQYARSTYRTDLTREQLRKYD